jgi:hypothetical protein
VQGRGEEAIGMRNVQEERRKEGEGADKEKDS